MSRFTDWLNHELEHRGWSYNELGRRAGLSSGGVSVVMTERQNPGYEFCVKVAQALQELPENVLQLAGLLPPLPPEVAEAREADRLLRLMTPERRRIALDVLRGLAGQPRSQSYVAPAETPERLLPEDDLETLSDWLRPMLMDEEAWQRNKEWYTRIFDSTPDALKEALIYGIGRAVAQIIQNRGKEGDRSSAEEEGDTQNEIEGK
jgi:transcriptional regulator with XRE-family HTH domain